MLLIFQYVKSDEAVRIVAHTGRKWLHKIGTAGTTEGNLRRQAIVVRIMRTPSRESHPTCLQKTQVYLDLGASILRPPAQVYLNGNASIPLQKQLLANKLKLSTNNLQFISKQIQIGY